VPALREDGFDGLLYRLLRMETDDPVGNGRVGTGVLHDHCVVVRLVE
jgi:hypothetical protein